MQKRKTTFDEAYEQAFSLACDALRARDLDLCCRHAGARIVERRDEGCTIEITFLHKSIRISFPDFVFSAEDGADVHIWEKILILHYLINADSTALDNALINYKQVKDGSLYFSTFEKRSIKPLVAAFGAEPHLLVQAAQCFGGREVDYGDVGVKIMAFAHVPLLFVIWKGDEEFPADANILFDASIQRRLSAEDIAVLCQQIAFRLIKSIPPSPR